MRPRATADTLVARIYTLLEPPTARPPSLAPTLSSSNAGLTQTSTTQRYAMIIAKYPVNGQKSKIFCRIGRRSVKESQNYIGAKRPGQIVKWDELCGLVSSMKVSQVGKPLFALCYRLSKI